MLAVLKLFVYLTCPASGQPRSSALDSTGLLDWQSLIGEQKPRPAQPGVDGLSLSYRPEDNNKTQLGSARNFTNARTQPVTLKMRGRGNKFR